MTDKYAHLLAVIPMVFYIFRALIDFIYISFIALAIIAGLIFLQRSSPLWHKVLLLFLVVTFLNETICFFLKKELISTIVYYNGYYYFRFPILAWVYFDAIKQNKLSAPFFKSFIVISFVMLIFNTFYYPNFFVLHTNYLLTGGLFIVFSSLIYLYSLIKTEPIVNPLTKPFFWISSGFLLYFLGVIPFLGVINLLSTKSFAIASQQFIISKSLSIVLYSLISFGFYLEWKQKK